MSQAEELLNTLTVSETEHAHPVVDSDTYFIIDPISREIENTARKKKMLMQGDHKSERFTFELPRYVEGHDMLLCTSVTAHYNNINGETGESYEDVADLTDLHIDESNPDLVLVSWLIRREATQHPGILSFLIKYICKTADGTIDYEWHTDIFSNIEIRVGRNNSVKAVINYTDILEEWRTRIFGTGESVMNNIEILAAEKVETIRNEGESQVEVVESAGEAQKSAIELKGSETLATIPEDYTTTYNMAEEAYRKKANAIEMEAEGTIIEVNDASNAHLLGLKLFGRTEQKHTNGVNILPNEARDTESLNVFFTVNNDRSVYVKGTATGTVYLTLSGGYAAEKMVIPDWLIPGETYTISDASIYLYKADGVQYNYTNQTFVMPSDCDYYGVFIRIGKDVSIDKLYYPMINIGDIALPYEPYTGGKPSPSLDYPQEIRSIESTTIDIYGNNVMNWPSVLSILKPGIADLSMKISNGVVSLSGTPTSNYWQANDVLTPVPKTWLGKKMYFKATLSGTEPYIVMYIKDANNGNLGAATLLKTGTYEFVMPENAAYTLFAFCLNKTTINTACHAEYSNLYLGFVDSEYEEYKEVQTLPVSHILHGLPTYYFGNYVESNGQKWICDAIDYERGVYIRRTNEIICTGEEEWTESSTYPAYSLTLPIQAITGKCSHLNTITVNQLRAGEQGIYLEYSGYAITQVKDTFSTLDEFKTFLAEQYLNGTPFTICYGIELPIETPLTKEEINIYKALHTNYLNNTIVNYDSTRMKITYAVDTCSYVNDIIQSYLTKEGVKLTDSATGKEYLVTVSNGQLTLTEIIA